MNKLEAAQLAGEMMIIVHCLEDWLNPKADRSIRQALEELWGASYFEELTDGKRTDFLYIALRELHSNADALTVCPAISPHARLEACKLLKPLKELCILLEAGYNINSEKRTNMAYDSNAESGAYWLSFLQNVISTMIISILTEDAER